MRGKSPHRGDEIRRRVLSDARLARRYLEQCLISELGGIVDQALKERGLTQKQAAELLGMRQPDLNALVRGRAKHLPTLRSLWRLSKGLDLHLVMELKPGGLMQIRQGSHGE